MMAFTVSHSFLLFILVFIAQTIRANAHSICETAYCPSRSWSFDPSKSSNLFPITIRFPFWLRESNRSSRCEYPGFDLTCNKKNQMLLTLPESGDFVVQLISNLHQSIWIRDQDQCLPRKVMLNHGFSLAGSPFQLGDTYTLANYSFYNCPLHPLFSSYMQGKVISCLSSTINNVTYAVVAVLSNSQDPTSWKSSCYLISSGLAPVELPPSLYWANSYNSEIQLKWEKPDCGNCEELGGSCSLLGDSTLQITCNLPGQDEGHSRKLKYGLTIGLGILGLLCIIGLVFFFHGRRRMPDQLRQASTEFSSLSIPPPPPPVILMGLDGASIEKYPKMKVGERGQLPQSIDNVCSICLGEYEPMETLRSIPQCNHYFHADCIDAWLKMNATCPLCRNLPERSSSSLSLPLSSNLFIMNR